MEKLKRVIKLLTPPALLVAAKWFLPPLLFLPFRRPSAVPLESPAPTSPKWYQGDYANWAEAVAAAEGYQAPNILEIQRASMRKIRDGEAVYERDSVLFDQIEYFFPTLAALLLVASRNDGKLAVLDFGGALGSSYYQNRQMLSGLSTLSWHVVEQPHFVATGQAEFENGVLRFFRTTDEAWRTVQPDVVLLSSVLQYLDRPMEFLKEIAQRDPPYILIDRTPVLDSGAERIVVQTVPPRIYPATYACRLFAPGAIEAALADRYDMVYDFETHTGNVIEVDDLRARFRGALFRKR